LAHTSPRHDSVPGAVQKKLTEAVVRLPGEERPYCVRVRRKGASQTRQLYVESGGVGRSVPI
jgi:hypothetical protein